jgi:tetratricopeptide (TPR) repeat protein
MDRNEEALEDAENLIRQDPDNYMAFYTIGMVYMNKEKYDTAVLSFSKCVSLNPNYGNGWNILGSILMRKYQQFTAALANFDKAISIEPNGLYYANRSICYYNMKDIEKAKADALIALEKQVIMPDNYLRALNIK